ncbi:MAG: DUF559 domain-containing protein [Polyangiaceae bacterium]|nr:DUF559 domain-containing protein [Polyangiaceae bacterium]
MSSAAPQPPGVTAMVDHTLSAWARAQFRAALARCESGAEEVLLIGLCSVGFVPIELAASVNDGARAMAEDVIRIATGSDIVEPSAIATMDGAPMRVVLVQQLPVSRYALDFAILAVDRMHGVVRVAVEVDGIEHDRIRDRAQRDRVRDRYLLSQDWTVVRFTATEASREPHRCAGEVMSLFVQQLMKLRGSDSVDTAAPEAIRT